MGASMVKGPTAWPLISTIPMEALRIFENGVSRIRRRRCSRRNPYKKRPMPAQKPTTQKISSPLGFDERWIMTERITRLSPRGGLLHIPVIRLANWGAAGQQETAGLAYVGNTSMAFDRLRAGRRAPL